MAASYHCTELSALGKVDCTWYRTPTLPRLSITLPPPHTPENTPLCAQVLITGLAKAQSLEAVLPVLDAWLVQQVEELEGGGDDGDDEEATQAPLQVMTLLMDTAARAEHTQLVLQVLSRMARIGVTPSPQVGGWGRGVGAVRVQN